MIVLQGGRYDGMKFGGEDGWKPTKADQVLYLGKPPADVWKRAVDAMGDSIITTAAVGVPYRSAPSHSPWDVSLHECEVYFRGSDGKYRVPSLDRCP